MAFTEFYCQTTASNLNAGSTTADAAAFTYAGGTFVRSTGVFTVASGDPASDGVTVGMFASIYTTSGATVATFIGRITSRDSTTITVSLSAIAGATSSVSESAGATTCKVGGAWKGPNAGVAFPFGFMTATMTDASSNMPRVNFKNGVTYSITSGMTHSIAGPIRIQGYTSSVGDGGRATIDGGTSNITLLTLTSANFGMYDMIFSNNGTGAVDGVLLGNCANFVARRCVFSGCRRAGFVAANSAVTATLIECEAYSCNANNSAAFAGIGSTGGEVTCIRCISHDNLNANGHGYYFAGPATLIDSIADSNAGDGFQSTNAFRLSGCDFYNNSGDGVEHANSSAMQATIENCNFTKNGGYGFNGSGAGVRTGVLVNNGFGAGTQVNTSGDTTGLSFIEVVGSVSYASNATPYVDAANGDFRITLAASKGAGRGTYTQTASSYAGTVAYPDIGAAQHQDSGGGGGATGSRGRLVNAGG